MPATSQGELPAVTGEKHFSGEEFLQPTALSRREVWSLWP